MHILDSYALNCGVKVGKPYVYEQYYPLGEEKYVTLQPFSRYEGKQYLYWNEVIEYIYPYLEKENIKIVQLGVREDRSLIKCIWTQGTTSVNQVAYLVRDSMLHLGVDSFAAHMASGYGKKSVSLHSTNWAGNTRPYWTTEEDGVTIEPDRSKTKPSFKIKDPGKQTINEIKPEKIAQTALDLLGVKATVPYETVYIGEGYTKIGVHLVPSSSVSNASKGLPFIVIRMDLEFDEEILQRQLRQEDVNVSIITNKAISGDLIKAYRKKIQDIIYFIDEKHDVEFVDFLHASGVNYVLVSQLEKEALENIKFDYLDYNFIFEKKVSEKARKEILKTPVDNLFYKTNKKLLKDGDAFSSVANLNKKMPDESLVDRPFHKVIDSDDFWEDLEDFYIVKKLD